MTKGGGHGDYRLIVFAPDSVQEAVDLTYSAFDTADKYRTPVVILGDGMIGQMMEPVEMPDEIAELPEKPWATTGCGKGERRIINSLYIEPTLWKRLISGCRRNIRLLRRMKRAGKSIFRGRRNSYKGPTALPPA